jgi:hypothetical protein
MTVYFSLTSRLGLKGEVRTVAMAKGRIVLGQAVRISNLIMQVIHTVYFYLGSTRSLLSFSELLWLLLLPPVLVTTLDDRRSTTLHYFQR